MTDTDASEDAKTAKLRYSDADFLRIVDDECRRSVGFGEGDSGELSRARIAAQEYRHGKIRDIPALKGRSAAVDSTLSDAVDTLMPDVMEVFFGGDDVATFQADGAEDEDQADEETAAVQHVVFSQNDAFRAFHDAIQDALLNRTGLFHWWWEEYERPLGSQEAGSTAEAAAMALMAQQQRPAAKVETEIRDDGTVALSFKELRGKVCFKAVPAEDFTVASDTIALRDTPYCALRDRPRVQDLIARGVDKKLARSLPQEATQDTAIEQERGLAGEYNRAIDGGIDDLRIVEVRTHYVRLDADDDGDVEIWRVETDAEQRIFLQKERVSQIPFGALTPYLIAHRFYGESLYDKLAEVMRIKTSLLRMLLDSGYFALNQRMEVSEQAANEFTIADLLNNAPNVPVRSKDGNAVRPISAGGLGFDVFSAMEYMSTVAEGRSGVVRNAQGLNPDTLHDTAEGAMQLINAAQKRVRFICRVLAETGVKDLFLGVHQMMREQFTAEHAPVSMKSGSDWKEIQPADWAEREGLTIHVGVGSAGKDKDLQVQQQALALTQEVIGLQGGVQGPFVDEKNVFNRLKAFSRAVGEKNPELYWTDPSSPEAQAKQAQQPPKPDPEMEKAKADMQLRQAQAASDAKLAQDKAQSDAALQAQKHQNDIAASEAQAQREMVLKRYQIDQELELKRQTTAAELQMKRELLMAELQMKRETAVMNAQVAHETGMAKAEASSSVSEVTPGGEPG